MLGLHKNAVDEGKGIWYSSVVVINFGYNCFLEDIVMKGTVKWFNNQKGLRIHLGRGRQ